MSQIVAHLCGGQLTLEIELAVATYILVAVLPTSSPFRLPALGQDL
jgi:hypothetical protein